MSDRVKTRSVGGIRWVDDGWEEIEVHDSLYGSTAAVLQGQPEAGVLCEHARELCSDGDGRATFTGLYAIYEDNQARWHTEWDIATPGESGAGAEIEDDAPGMEAIEVHELRGALRYERYAADQPYIQCGLKDKAVLLNRFRLPEEGRLCMAAD